jgi:hypothetical protein
MKILSRAHDINCPECGARCGRYYPATWNDPGFCEGPGEDFVQVDGHGDQIWHCSQECLDEATAEEEKDSLT